MLFFEVFGKVMEFKLEITTWCQCKRQCVMQQGLWFVCVIIKLSDIKWVIFIEKCPKNAQNRWKFQFFDRALPKIINTHVKWDVVFIDAHLSESNPWKRCDNCIKTFHFRGGSKLSPLKNTLYMHFELLFFYLFSDI